MAKKEIKHKNTSLIFEKQKVPSHSYSIKITVRRHFFLCQLATAFQSSAPTLSGLNNTHFLWMRNPWWFGSCSSDSVTKLQWSYHLNWHHLQFSSSTRRISGLNPTHVTVGRPLALPGCWPEISAPCHVRPFMGLLPTGSFPRERGQRAGRKSKMEATIFFKPNSGSGILLLLQHSIE